MRGPAARPRSEPETQKTAAQEEIVDALAPLVPGPVHHFGGDVRIARRERPGEGGIGIGERLDPRRPRAVDRVQMPYA